MSVTFTLSKETLKMFNDKVCVCLEEIFPEGFDDTPVVDPEMPEYGPITPENPWSLNVSNSNARNLLETLGFYENSELIGSIDPSKLMDACDNALATILAFPDLDSGTPSEEYVGVEAVSAFYKVLGQSPFTFDDTQDRTTNAQMGPRFIQCGHLPGYFNNRYSKLRDLAVIAKQHDAVVSYC